MWTAWITKVCVTVVGLAAIAYVGLCLFLLTQQRQFIFFPTAPITTTPAEFGAAYEEVWLPIAADRATDQATAAADSALVGQLHGWWLPADQPPAAAKTPSTVLYLHGNGENISANADHAARFQRMGFSVLVFDYRGYGQSSPPFPSEQQVYADAEVAWHYLTQQRRIPAEQIVIYGHSLGGAIATELALRQPNAASLIVQGSFTSIRDVAAGSGDYPGIPIRWLLTQRFDSLHKVGRLQMPLLLIHGQADTEVPAAMSQQLYDQAPAPKALWLVPIAGHSNVSAVTGEERYADVIRRFVAGQVSGRIAEPTLDHVNLSTTFELPGLDVQPLS